MNGTAIASEGYVRTVADQGWHLVAVGDYNGDGRADLLWRHASSGDTYVYPMNGTTILAGEGYLRNVPSAWKVVSPLNGGELGGRCDASAAETQVYDSTMRAESQRGHALFVGLPRVHVAGVRGPQPRHRPERALLDVGPSLLLRNLWKPSRCGAVLR